MYQWVQGKRFLRYTSKDENSTNGIIGIDPATGEATWWCFYKHGGVSKAIMTQDTPDRWTLKLTGDGKVLRLLGTVIEGEVSLTIETWKTGPDETKSVAKDLTVDGVARTLPGTIVTWTRKGAPSTISREAQEFLRQGTPNTVEADSPEQWVAVHRECEERGCRPLCTNRLSRDLSSKWKSSSTAALMFMF